MSEKGAKGREGRRKLTSIGALFTLGGAKVNEGIDYRGVITEEEFITMRQWNESIFPFLIVQRRVVTLVSSRRLGFRH